MNSNIIETKTIDINGVEAQLSINGYLDEKMYSFTHKSGLKVRIFPKKGFSKYYAIYGTEYGSIDRQFVVPGESELTTVPDGIAHYLEHKMFEQKDGKNAFDMFALTGASANAFTSFDMTAYLFSCTDKFYDSLDILISFVNEPYFTEENVQKEQGIIGQEIKMYEDDPNWRVFFNALTALYHNNPVKIDIAGTVESISHITPEILYKCYNTFYNPSNMTLVLVGDIEPEKVLDCLDKHISPERNLGEIERPRLTEPDEFFKSRVEQELMVSQPLFQIGFKDNTLYTDGEELLKREIMTDVILEVIFGKSNDFYMSLYEQGLINQSFGSESELEKRFGFTLIGGESKDPDKVFELVKAEINKTIEFGLDKESLERAKKTTQASLIKLFNSIEGMGNAFIRQIMCGVNPLALANIIDEIAEEEYNERLKKYFNTDNCVLSVVRPVSAQKGGDSN